MIRYANQTSKNFFESLKGIQCLIQDLHHGLFNEIQYADRRVAKSFHLNGYRCLIPMQSTRLHDVELLATSVFINIWWSLDHFSDCRLKPLTPLANSSPNKTNDFIKFLDWISPNHTLIETQFAWQSTICKKEIAKISKTNKQ